MLSGTPLIMLALPLLATAFRIWAVAREDGEVRISIWDCAVDQLVALGLYGVLGPPLGALPFLLVTMSMDGELKHLLLVIPLSLFSYPLGIVPAVATAGVIGALKPWLWGWRALAVSSGVGAVLSLVWGLASGVSKDVSGAAFLTSCGAIAGLACARIWFGSPRRKAAWSVP